MIDPTFAAILAMIHAGPRWETMEPAALRSFIEATRTPQERIAGVGTRDLRVGGAAGELGARLYMPDGVPSPAPGLIYFHGGGWVLGDLESQDSICRRLAKLAGIRILSVDYRLSPEHRFPAAHEDALESTKWGFDHADELGLDRDRMAIGGDSAGANMAASVGLSLNSDPERRLRFQLLLYPTTQITRETASRRELGEGHFVTAALYEYFLRHLFDSDEQRSDPRVDLLNRDDLARSPPTFLSVGSYDILRDENRDFARALEHEGVAVEYREYPSFIHGFYSFAPFVPAVLPAFDDAAAALKRALA